MHLTFQILNGLADKKFKISVDTAKQITEKFRNHITPDISAIIENSIDIGLKSTKVINDDNMPGETSDDKIEVSRIFLIA